MPSASPERRLATVEDLLAIAEDEPFDAVEFSVHSLLAGGEGEETR